jgi:hypothetical protein
METETLFKWPENLPIVWQDNTWQPRVVVRRAARSAANHFKAAPLDSFRFSMLRRGIMGGAARSNTSGTQPRINL